MNKCSCWEEKYQIIGWHNAQTPMFSKKPIQRCNGTKEREECTCNGDTTKCNFYPDKRKEKKTMNTAEMYLQAKKDGKYYKTGSIVYQKDRGLLDDYFNNYGDLSTWNFDDFMKLSWEAWENVMTKSEAEKRFNIKIVDD